MYQSLACPHDNSSPVQARITKFGPEKQNFLVKIPIVFGSGWPWPSRSNLTSNSKLTPFWACPTYYASPIQVRISKFGPQMHFSAVILFWPQLIKEILSGWNRSYRVNSLPEASFGLRVFLLPASVSVRQSVRPSVTKFVRVITHQPFKLGSPNLDQRCERPSLISLLFCGRIDLDLQGQIELRSQNLPHFELVHAITHHQLKLQFPNLEQKCILALFRSLPILGLIEIDLQFNF